MKRDKDYRGTKTTVDWSKLVHQVRTKKPGALEVLQDAIMIYFPRQFEHAKDDAWTNANRINANRPAARRVVFYVGFDAQKARRRFLSSSQNEHRLASRRALSVSESPFILHLGGAIRTSKPLPHTAYVYVTRRFLFPQERGLQMTGRHEPRYERKALRPKFTGAYKRPKVPIIYWYRRGPDDVGEDEIEETVLLVRGPGSAAWARNHDLYNERWQIWRNEAGEEVGAILTLDGVEDWRKDAREQGIKNKTRFLEYPPDRSFFG